MAWSSRPVLAIRWPAGRGGSRRGPFTARLPGPLIAGAAVALTVLAAVAWAWWQEPAGEDVLVLDLPVATPQAPPVDTAAASPTAPAADTRTAAAALGRAAAPPPPVEETPSPLPPVPDPALIAEGRDGLLPVVGADGREPWQVYARPFDASDRRPRIAIVLTDLGLSELATSHALRALPPAVTVSFTPYAGNLQSWVSRARTEGHEVLLQLPMEPLEFPASDPGPNALLTSLAAADNIERLDWLLARFAGYVGVVPSMGSRFAASTGDMRPVLQALRGRGLMYLDLHSTFSTVPLRLAREFGLPYAAVGRAIDGEASRTAIDGALAELERAAISHGSAVGVALPYPVSVERIAAWAAGLPAKGLVLAPVSALAARPGPTAG